MLYVLLKINHNLTETDLDTIKKKVYFRRTNSKTGDERIGLAIRFNKINSMIIYFWKNGEINGSSYIKIPLRSSAILNILKMVKNIVSFGRY